MSEQWHLEVASGLLVIKHIDPEIVLADWRGRLWVGKKGQSVEVDFSSPFQMDDGPIVFRQSEDGVMVEIEYNIRDDLTIRATIENQTPDELPLEMLEIGSREIRLGRHKRPLSFFKNGYQSWTETRTMRAVERQRVPIIPFLNILQDNVRNLPPGRRGEFTSELFGVLGSTNERAFLLAGQNHTYQHFCYQRVRLPQVGGEPAELTLIFDMGGMMLAPGEQILLNGVVLMAGDHANRIQDRYFDLLQAPKADRRPTTNGWCSWYTYYSGIDQKAIEQNLVVVRDKKPDWQVFMLDDGYQTAVGDWLSINDRFPKGLAYIAQQIRDSGLAPGLWLAPFIALRKSQVFREHPDWLIRKPNNRPYGAGWNPNWGFDGFFYGLDVTHPGFQDYLRSVIHSVVHEFGFRFLKLDFTYGAALPGVVHDRSLSPAERLALGHRIIREEAGEDVTLLGCGCPLAPAIGLVDAMRIGPDVAPYWFDWARIRLTRDPHALCTRFAIRSILNRCQMQRKLWINDPDCLMLRDSRTKLIEDERMSLANAIIITGGMVMLSDRLPELQDEAWDQLDRVLSLAAECDKGRPWPLDIMEKETPEMVYNSAGYLAVFNILDRPTSKQIPYCAYLADLLPASALFQDIWSGEQFTIKDGVLDLGVMNLHASRLLGAVSG
ncbi:MAG: alpha-galactosidase [Anaerolineales bacterium]|nr:alpha-galactosidase [Anaerolineales bacterium]